MSIRIGKTPFTSLEFAGLLFEYQWVGEVLTYSIPSGTAYFPRNYSIKNEWDNWYALSASEAQKFRSLIDELNTYLDLSIIEVPDSSSYGDIRIAYTDAVKKELLGYAYLPTPIFINSTIPSNLAGDIWLSPELFNQDSREGSLLHHILMHELGHAMGLSHPFEAERPFPKTASQYDNYQYSVMSYSWHPDHEDAYPVTFMPLDILALQYLYGTNLNHSPENTVYEFNDVINIRTIWDPNGYNTLDFSSVSHAAHIDINEGSFSSVGLVNDSSNRSQLGSNNLALAYGTKIHEVIGTHDSDVITGNFLDNTVYLNSGDDTYVYMGGQDIVYGGHGLNTVILPEQLSNWTLNPYNPDSGMYHIELARDSSFSLQFTNINTLQFVESSYLVSDLFETTPISEQFNITLANPNNPPESAVITDFRTIEAEEAQLYRIYLGVLDRLPDQAGFQWWINRYQQDASFDQLIAGFYNSFEFRLLADVNNDGVISNTELLNHLYNNVLGRAADTQGFNWWLNTIEQQSVAHTEVIFNFTQSDEFVLDTLQTVGEFLWA